MGGFPPGPCDRSMKTPAGEYCVSCIVSDTVLQMVRPVQQDLHKTVYQRLSHNIHLVNPRFYANRQEDAQEFLTHLLDRLERDCKSRGTPQCSFFRGRLASRVTCEACGAHSDTHDPFETLSLEIGGNTDNVQGVLRSFLSREKLEGANAYRCGSAACGNALKSAVKAR
jgi:ubiquitin carboxyl-terminal hydrolase 36/42